MPVSLPVFIEAAARASVILATTGLVAVLMRRSSASARHLVWVLGLTSALLVPALSLAMPKLEVPIVRVAGPRVVGATPDLRPEGRSYLTKDPVAGRDRSIAPGLSRELLPANAANLPAETGSYLTQGVLFAIWALGAAIVLGRLFVGLIAVQWMSRRTRVVTDGPWIAQARQLADDLGVSRVRFVQSATASMPMALGIVRPSVLMPATADAWPPHRLRVVLLHELAHVKRRDCLTHAVAQIVCAAYWFNPLAWIAVRRLRAERERACDDLVLAAGTRGSDYADELLDIARVMHAERFPAVMAGASLAMAHRSQLEGRLIAILDPSVPRRGLTRARAASAAAVFAILIVSVASVQPWAEARTPDAVTGQELAPAQEPVKPIDQHRDQTTVRVHTNSQVDTRQITTSVTQAVNDVTGSVAVNVGNIVGGVVGGVVEGVVGGVVGGVTGGMKGAHGRIPTDAEIEHAIEQAMPFVAGQARPHPNPDPHPVVAGEGSHGKIDPRAAAALMEALKDTDKEVRETAMHALVQMRDPRMFEPLVAALKDASADVREQAAFGLGQLRDARAVDPLSAAIHDAVADVREQVVFALGQIHDRRSIEPLISALKDPNEDVREQAAFALGQMRDVKAVEALVIALKDSKEDVREQAAFALGQIGDARAIEGLTTALKDASASVRQQAAFALGQIRY